uniref:DUF4817 domain-containing protein n=1 Tax=Angiostrongylus cantonensis TaxID=6313 RepID=A0A0K0DIH7_ANGCA
MKAGNSKITWRHLSPEKLELTRQRGIARAACNCQLTSELAEQCFANYKIKMIALRRSDGTVTASKKAMEKIIHEYYSDLFDSYFHFASYEIKED